MAERLASLALGLAVALTAALVVPTAEAATATPDVVRRPATLPTAPHHRSELASALPTSHRLLITGDSITQGSSGDYTWRYRLWKKLKDTAPEQVTFVGTTSRLYDNVHSTQGSPYYAVPFSGEAHAASWGTLLYDEVDRVAAVVEATGADTLVTMLGINDIVWQSASAADIKAMFRTYVQRARAAAPGIDIVLCKVLSRYDFFSHDYLQVAETRAVASALTELAAEMSTRSQRVVVADTLSGWDAREHTWDGTHPNPTGETLIAQRVSAALAKLGVGTAAPSIYAPTRWGVRTAAPAVTAGAEEATASWDRTPSGATAMYLEYNLTNEKEGYQQLPYGIADQSSWRLSPLVAGGTYKFRTVPIKGFMTGRPGGATERTVGAKPFDRTVPGVTAAQRTGDVTGIVGRWSPADNAQGYLLSYRTMAYTSPVTQLPYPVGAGVSSWDLHPLGMGRYYKFRVVPVRGYVRGRWQSSSNVRTKGVANARAYIALGDSYSSGLGTKQDASDYELGVDCRRTSAAWAFQMQDRYNAATKLVACQGDEIGEGLDGGVRAQLAKIQPFFKEHPRAPQLVTVTVGGNDVGFGEKVEYCISNNCEDHEAVWSDEISRMTFPLHNFYDDLRDAAPNADIVVGGYPIVVDVRGLKKDPLCIMLSHEERVMFAKLTNQLDTVIDNAAEDTIRTGVHRTPIWSAGASVQARFVNHGACQYDPGEWINSWTLNGGLKGKAGLNTLHPKSAGQLGYAYAFSDALLQEAE